MVRIYCSENKTVILINARMYKLYLQYIYSVRYNLHFDIHW